MLETNRDFFVTLEKVLLRCWVFGFALLAFSVGVFLLCGDMVDKIQGSLFDVTPHELDLIIYCALGLLKLLVIGLFFLPWLAIKLVLRKDAPTG